MCLFLIFTLDRGSNELYHIVNGPVPTTLQPLIQNFGSHCLLFMYLKTQRVFTVSQCLLLSRQCFVEMENAENAEKMAEAYRINLPKFYGKRLTVYVSRKYRQLKHG